MRGGRFLTGSSTSPVACTFLTVLSLSFTTWTYTDFDFLKTNRLLLVGIVVTFWGFRYLDFSLFVVGGFIPAFFMFGILGATVPNDNPDKTAIVYATSFAVWILSGIILICCVKLAVFVLGFAFGALLALTLNPVLLKYVWTDQPLANAVIWAVVFGIIGALLALCFERILLIVATAFGGSFAIVGSIAAMSGTFNVGVSSTNGDVVETLWNDWAYFAGILGVWIFGIIIQLCLTAPAGLEGGYSKMD